MLNEAHYGAVLNFFYFLLLDEGLALNAAYKTTKLAQKKIKGTEDETPLLITMMSETLHKYRKRHGTLQSILQPPKSDWKTPNREFLGAWKDYMRRSTDDSPEILVLYYILNYPISAISKGLGIPEGTIYYRIGRGLEGFAQGSFSSGSSGLRSGRDGGSKK